MALARSVRHVKRVSDGKRFAGLSSVLPGHFDHGDSRASELRGG